MTTLVTGAAGFIGYHLCKTLLKQGEIVIGVDNLNDYYDVNLKKNRLADIEHNTNFTFVKADIANKYSVNQLFEKTTPRRVVNLAAQAGVRYSLENPGAYMDSNLFGFCHVLEACRHHNIEHLVFASSSSVYGANETTPFAETDNIDHPMSLYAASKKANELMAHSYASLYQLPCTGLRFFTVYGPWGRPDMAYFKFVKNILNQEPIDVYNHGNMSRDFTYIDDIVEGIIRALNKPAVSNAHWDGKQPDPATSYAPYRIYNIGHGEPDDLMDFIQAIEDTLGMKAIINSLPMQPGDVPKTAADITRLKNELGYTPKTPIRMGVKHFIQWYTEYHQLVSNT